MQAILMIGLAAVGIAAGASALLQQVLIANLRSAVGSPFWAVLISYVGGTIATALVVAMAREPMLSIAGLSKAPWLSWFAGVFGVIYIVLAVILIPKLGAATVLALLVAGQLLASIACDHFGLFGLPQRPVDVQRLAGAVMLLGGVMLIRR